MNTMQLASVYQCGGKLAEAERSVSAEVDNAHDDLELEWQSQLDSLVRCRLVPVGQIPATPASHTVLCESIGRLNLT